MGDAPRLADEKLAFLTIDILMLIAGAIIFWIHQGEDDNHEDERLVGPRHFGIINYHT